MAIIFTKDPSAVLDYQVDWSTWLDGDTITTSAWVVPAGITETTSTNTATTATIWLSGGTAGERYRVTNRIVTAGGRTDDRTITIRVEDK